MIDRLLNGTTDGIINQVQIRAIRWPRVWLNELHVLTLPETQCALMQSFARWRHIIFPKLIQINYDLMLRMK